MSRGVRRAAAAVLVLCAACGSGGPAGAGDADAPPTAPGAPAGGSGPVAAVPPPDAAVRCADGSGAGMHAVGFDGAGVRLYGIEAGTGPRGVVLVPGTDPLGLCAWTGPMPALADAGFHVLALDRVCTGSSGCPAPPVTVEDVRAAVAELGRRGGLRVVLVGAGEGASAAVVAAAVGGDSVRGVVALSAGPPGAAVSEQSPRDARAAASLLRVPALYAVARDDPALAATRALHAATGTPGTRLSVLPAGRGSGARLLYADAGAVAPGGSLFGEFLGFVRAATER